MAVFRYFTGEDVLKNKPPRQTAAMLTLFLFLSAWLHLLFFVAWGRSGFDFTEIAPVAVAPPMPPVEIVLDIAPLETAADQEPPAPEEPAEPETAPPVKAELFSPAPPEGQTAAGLAPALEGGAELMPDDSAEGHESGLYLETEAPRLKSYFTPIRSRVARHWILPPAAQNRFKPGRLSVDVTIDSAGNLVRLLVLESSGSATLDNAGLEALRTAAPFDPFPPELALDHEQLDIRMNFDYQAHYVLKKK